MATARFIITKFALTTGVFCKRGEVCDTTADSMIKIGRGDYYHRPDWHLTVEEAVDRVQVMRESALKSLRRKVAKLEAMDIEAEVRVSLAA